MSPDFEPALERRQNLAETSKYIKELLQKLSENYSSAELPVQAVKQIEKNPQMKDRVLSALKEGSIAALESLVDHPAISIVLAAVKGYGDDSDE